MEAEDRQVYDITKRETKVKKFIETGRDPNSIISWFSKNIAQFIEKHNITKKITSFAMMATRQSFSIPQYRMISSAVLATRIQI